MLDLGSGLAGSMPGMILADNGADVVKVEPPWGARERGTRGHQTWNRGKRSIAVDLSTDSGRTQLADLAARADVVISNFGPGSADRLRIAPDVLPSANPALVSCVIDGFGPLGTQFPLPGFDGLVSALTGRMGEVDLLSGAVPGQARRGPVFTAAPILAYGAAQLAVQGVLAALVRRARTGRGDVVRTSLLQAWTVFMMRHPLQRNRESMTDLPETMQRGLELCFMTARCADGRFIQMCARQDVHFRNWLRALGLQDALHDDRFTGLPLAIPGLAAVAELESLVRARMATRSRDDWMRLFTTEFDVGADPFLTPLEFLSHPQLICNDRVVTTTDPVLGPVRQIGLLARLDGTPGSVRGPAPRLGSDTVDGVSQTWPMRTSAAVASGGPHELPLAGITVLELAHFVAGPLAGTLLAEMGARVIKIEPLAGDPFRRTGAQSVKFLVGKESIAIDLKHPDAQAIVDGLILRSDVFVHSFRPDVPARLGLGYERLAALASRLIYVNASAYGSRGPQRGRSAFHSTPTALSGAGFLQAGSGNPPVDDSFPDPGGALGVATAVLLALHARQLTGEGQYVETTMLTSAGYVMSAELAQYAGAPDIPIPDNGQHGRGALYRLYSCATGWLFLAAVDPSDWAAVVDVLAQPAWADQAQFSDPVGRLLNWQSLAEMLATAFLARPAQDWVTALQARGVGAVVVTERPSETWLQEHDLLSADQHPAFGDYWRLPPKLTWADTVPCAAPAAALGEHSLELLVELGYSDDVIATLVADGVVGTWSRDTAAVLG